MSALMHWQNTVGRIRAQMTAAASATSSAKTQYGGSSQGGDSAVSLGGDEERTSGGGIRPPVQQPQHPMQQRPTGQPQAWDSSSTVTSSLAAAATADGGPFSFAAAAAATAADGSTATGTSDGGRPSAPAAAAMAPSPFSGVSGRSAASSATSEITHASIPLIPGVAASSATAAFSSLSSYPPSSIGGQRPPVYQLPEDMPAMPMPGQPTTSLTPAATAWLNSVVAAKKGPQRGLPPASPSRQSLSMMPEEGGEAAGPSSSSGRLPLLLLPVGSDAESQGTSGTLRRLPQNHVGVDAAAPPPGPSAGTAATSVGAGAVWDQDLAVWGHRPGGGSGAVASAGPQSGASAGMVALAQASELEERGSENVSAKGGAVTLYDFEAAERQQEGGSSVGAAHARAAPPSSDLASPFASMLLVTGLLDECGGGGQQTQQASSQFKVAGADAGSPLQDCIKPPSIVVIAASGSCAAGRESGSPADPHGGSGLSNELPSPFANLNLVLSLEEGAAA